MRATAVRVLLLRDTVYRCSSVVQLVIVVFCNAAGSGLVLLVCTLVVSSLHTLAVVLGQRWASKYSHHALLPIFLFCISRISANELKQRVSRAILQLVAVEKYLKVTRLWGVCSDGDGYYIIAGIKIPTPFSLPATHSNRAGYTGCNKKRYCEALLMM